MKTKILYRLLLLAGAIATISMFSCNKDLDKTDNNSITVDGAFKTAADLQGASHSSHSNTAVMTAY